MFYIFSNIYLPVLTMNKGVWPRPSIILFKTEILIFIFFWLKGLYIPYEKNENLNPHYQLP